jgi:hypothetical protein
LVDYVDKLDDKRGQENRASSAHVADMITKLGATVESQFKETNSKIVKLDKDLSDQMVKEIKRQSTPLALKIVSIASLLAGLLSYFQFEIVHPTIRPPSSTIEKNTRA